MAVTSPYLFAYKLIEYPERLACEKRWNEAFGESSSEAHYLLAPYVVFFYIPVALLTILYSISLVKVKSQKTSGEQSANTEEQRAKRNRNVLKIDGRRSRVSVCTVLVAFQHYLSLNFLTWDAVD